MVAVDPLNMDHFVDFITNGTFLNDACPVSIHKEDVRDDRASKRNFTCFMDLIIQIIFDENNRALIAQTEGELCCKFGQEWCNNNGVLLIPISEFMDGEYHGKGVIGEVNSH
jgi:hypothetical protein